jgi:hypothetical protein
MASGQPGVLRDIRRLLQVGTAVGMTDAQLLGAFAGGCDESAELAFEAIVDRHGSCAMSTRPRTPFRQRSWSLPARRGLCGSRTLWEAGCMVSPTGSPPRRGWMPSVEADANGESPRPPPERSIAISPLLIRRPLSLKRSPASPRSTEHRSSSATCRRCRTRRRRACWA